MNDSYVNVETVSVNDMNNVMMEIMKVEMDVVHAVKMKTPNILHLHVSVSTTETYQCKNEN